eukprot:3384124-Pyramimonas_sp.AAC.1
MSTERPSTVKASAGTSHKTPVILRFIAQDSLPTMVPQFLDAVPNPVEGYSRQFLRALPGNEALPKGSPLGQHAAPPGLALGWGSD